MLAAPVSLGRSVFHSARPKLEEDLLPLSWPIEALKNDLSLAKRPAVNLAGCGSFGPAGGPIGGGASRLCLQSR